jgi:hypothetical protein
VARHSCRAADLNPIRSVTLTPTAPTNDQCARRSGIRNIPASGTFRHPEPDPL